MRKVVYYVACSIDGFIAGPDKDISGFVRQGNGIDKYRNDLLQFDTVIMGKNTYEFGYRFGLQPGQPAYPHMKHYIFSTGLVFKDHVPGVHVRKIDIKEIIKIRTEPGTDIYLCGGGQFAGWLLDNRQIDILKIKLNPFVLGQGVKMFGNSGSSFQTKLIDTATYDHGLQITDYKILY